MEKKIILYRIGIITLYTLTFSLLSDQCSIARYFWANYQHFQKKPREAEIWFSKIFQDQPPLAAYEGYIKFLFSSKKFSIIYSMKDFLMSHFSSNPSLMLALADVLTLYKEEIILNDILLHLQLSHANNPNLTLRVVSILLEQKAFTEAITRIDALLNKTSRNPNIFLFHFMKAQIYLQTDQIEDAIFATKKSTELFPYFDKSWLMLGILYEQLGATKEAINSYQQYALYAEKPSPLFTQRSPLLETQHVKLKESAKDNQKREEIKKQAIAFIEEKKYGDAMRYIDILLEHEPENKEIKKLKITTLIHQKQHQTADNILQTYIENDADHKIEWLELSQQLIGTNSRR